MNNTIEGYVDSDKCPCCGKIAQGFFDYPYAKITGYGRIPLSDSIKGPLVDTVPLEISHFFRIYGQNQPNPKIPKYVYDEFRYENPKGLVRGQDPSNTSESYFYELVHIIKGKSDTKEEIMREQNISEDNFLELYKNEKIIPSVRIYPDMTNRVAGFLNENQLAFEQLSLFNDTVLETKKLKKILRISSDSSTTIDNLEFAINEYPSYGPNKAKIVIESLRRLEDSGLIESYTANFSLPIAEFNYRGLFKKL